MPGKSGRIARLSPVLGNPADIIDDYLPDNGNLGYRVSRYDLALQYKVTANRLSGVATITATASSHLKRLQLDLATSMTVARVAVNGERLRYTHRRGKLAVTLTTPVPPGGALSIVVRYAGNPRPIRGRWGEVGWEELDSGSLCANQPNGAPSWFPCDDHPISKASYRIAITTDSPFHVVANGVLAEKRTKAAQTTWVFEQAEPMTTYLASIQIGRYETVKLATTPVPVDLVAPRSLRLAAKARFAPQVEMLAVFTEMFGPYPFPRYTAVVTEDPLEIPLEAQGFSTFGANHCEPASDAERLVAHELAHQWFGNSVTLSRWRDIWLHEGFACYAEWLWSERSGGRTAAQWAEHYYAKLAATPISRPLADPGPDHMFDDWVYKRGALTLHALRLRIGDDAFFALLRHWTEKHRYGSVSTEDFTTLAADHSNEALTDLWRAWLHAPELPPFPLG
ncbi:putative aminopeptidase [Gordonia araii NBRC 100433]|uniref:Aminopeptidase N n=1 Tax=Gordonia araii NBRC 100433 TaxID=1073574 RepID=G7GY61_9ACTN|nr:M1 family metallopeptidase [Gordonia araii]NNG98144.1 M1 family metallopeptidase [Gordonia araii NBRC 100433]GAB08536.1 putative aminopeptidase [Gordonia araii NBRC 100433]